MRALTLAFLVFFFTGAKAAVKYKASEFSYCPEIKGPRAFYFTIHDRFVNDQQEFIGNATMLKDFGNENTFLIDVYKVLKKKDIHLVTLKGKGGCTTMNQQGGAAWMKVATLAKVPNPDKCPIKKAAYFLDGYIPISPEQIPLLKMVPKGKFKILLMQNETSGKLDFCCTFFFERF